MPVRLGLLGLALVAAVAGIHAQSGRTAGSRHVSVAVVGKNNTPAPAVAPKDLIVKEDGLTREILTVSADAVPSHLVILIDDSAAAEPLQPDLRRALTAFLASIAGWQPAPLVQLVTFGSRPTVRVPFTTGRTTLGPAVDRLFSQAGTGAYFLQALRDAARDLSQRRADRGVIVAFVAENGPEFSSETVSTVRDAIKAAGAALFTMVLQSDRPDDSAEGRERASVLGDVTKASGGLNRVVLSSQGIEGAFEELASVLAHRVDVAYARPQTLIPPTKLAVETRDKAFKALAPVWAAQ